MKIGAWRRLKKRRKAMAMRMKGKSVAVVAEACGVTRQSVSKWWRDYVHGGEEALLEKPRGRPSAVALAERACVDAEVKE